MAFAPNYEPTTDFSQDEANNVGGRSTARTANLDAELNNISTSINALNNNLKALQRSDNKLKDGVVEMHALSDEVSGRLVTPEYLQQINNAVNQAETYKNSAAESETEAANSANESSNSAGEAAASAASALEILTTTMRKITVNTDDDIPAFASLLSDYIIKVKSSERNGGFSTTYYFDFDNQSLSWIPTVGI